ncbi:MAG: hypothetical protein Q9208_002180 [Pyrenodesmia sp. 3 TL-2023]
MEGPNSSLRFATQRKEFTCTFQAQPNQDPCHKSFTRVFNLERHVQRQHGIAGFRYSSAVDAVAQSGMPQVGRSPEYPQRQGHPPDNVASDLAHGRHLLHGFGMRTDGADLPSDGSTGFELKTHLEQYLSEPDLRTDPSSVASPSDGSGEEASLYPIEPDVWAVADTGSLGGSEPRIRDGNTSGSSQEVGSRKRCGSFDAGDYVENYNRISKARRLDSVPRYLVKSSTTRQGNPQVKALEWLGAPAKRLFDDTYGAMLSRWGVPREHTGTCVLVPEAWSSLEPTLLMSLFSSANCPTTDLARLSYRHSDHTSTFARALAWFQKSTRRGIDLDNFLGCGPFKPMDASHLCHHSHCIVHIEYEGAHINQDRRRCLEAARAMRTNKTVIPAQCDQHQPPCLLQHASLTTLEAYCIQFAVLAKAKQVPAKQVSRPQRHRYSTFESRLPCSADLTAISVESSELRPNNDFTTVRRKPDLLCSYCNRIKAFKTVTGLWSHIFHKHSDVDDASRLTEMRRLGVLWREYLIDYYPHNVNEGNITIRRLYELQKDDVSWDAVIAWKLRGG